VAGAGLLSAPATLPDRQTRRDIDDELLDLLCEDEVWLDETFNEIVATSWAEPPRGGTARPAARPRRWSARAGRAPRHDGSRRSQWCPHPHRRQRSPPEVV
jgi:hypothetical protein